MKKLIKNNWQLIAFYIIFAIVLFMWCEHVEKTNEKITNQKNNIMEVDR
jgi:YbbR domain-containing protein